VFWLDLYLKEFEKLNEYQRKAVMDENCYVLLNAAVGSGKTTVLVHKVLYLHFVKMVPLEEMIVLTFTNKATEEMISRISAFGEDLLAKMRYFGTFHSIARRILSDNKGLKELGYDSDFQIIDNDAAGEMLQEIIKNSKLNIKYKAKLVKRIEEFKNGKPLYGIMKNNDDIDELVDLYNKEKLSRNVMDFDDIIDNCISILTEPLNSKWIIIDEFQDTDFKQLELIQRISGRNTKIFCIGDPNQIIYSWRSGTDSIFNDFKRIFKPKEMGLPLNYRSSKTIVEAANSFLYGSNIVGTKDYGSKIKILKHYDAFNEAKYIANMLKNFYSDGIPYKDMAILYRRQAQLEVLLNVLVKEEIPCRAVLKKVLPTEDLEAFQSNENGVNLLTLHASKGLEFSHVFIIGANMGNIPISSKSSEEPEELRLFYVGITRAKNHLEISYLTNPSMQGAQAYKSPYLTMIPKDLLLIEEESIEVKNSIPKLINILRQDRIEKAKESENKAKHLKYGVGNIIYEDEETIRVDFEIYGTKEFSKLFCPLERI
jgi:superfamily I DNA/RNA helicase